MPTEEVGRLHLHSQINQPDFRGRITFADLAHHDEQHELGEQDDATDPKAFTTVAGYKRVLRNRLIPRWGKRVALSIQPLGIEQGLKGMKRSLHRPMAD